MDFGFERLNGVPDAIEQAARRVDRLADAFTHQSHHVGHAERMARGDGEWAGDAANAYSEFSSQLMGRLDTNARICSDAAAVVAQFDAQYRDARHAVNSAMDDCERLETEIGRHDAHVGSAQVDADAAVATAQAFAGDAQHAHYQRLADAAQRRLGVARSARSAVQSELADAMARGRRTCRDLDDDAAEIRRRLTELMASLCRKAPELPNSPAVPVSVNAADAALANAMMKKAGDDELNLADAAALEALAGRPLSPGALQQFIADYVKKHSRHPGGFLSDLANVVGGFIYGVTNFRTFGDDKSETYKVSEKVGSIGTDMVVGGIGIASGGLAVVGAVALVTVVRSGGNVEQHGLKGLLDKHEGWLLVQAGVDLTPEMIVGGIGGLSGLISSSGTYAERIVAAKAAIRDLEEGVDPIAGEVTIGGRKYSVIKVVQEVGLGAGNQALEREHAKAQHGE